jgi:hypothetical protein
MVILKLYIFSLNEKLLKNNIFSFKEKTLIYINIKMVKFYKNKTELKIKLYVLFPLLSLTL